MAQDWKSEEIRRLVVMGESTVEGGGWLPDAKSQRWADVLARLIEQAQGGPITYVNAGIGANAISPRSPGYESSRKPSALERYQKDVIAHRPDCFVVCYGLNDMRAAMDAREFAEDLTTLVREVKAACQPLTVLTTVYHMTGWKWYALYDKGSSELTRVYNDVIREVAEAQGCLVADVWAGEGGADWLIHDDGVHANRVGNLVIAHRVFEVLAQHCRGLSRRAQEEAEDTEWTRAARRWRSG